MDFLPPPGTPIQEVDTPSLILDLPTLEQNIETIHAFFRDRPMKVRSVTKSHKCPAIAQLQMTADGAVPYGLSCAKVSEAEVMVRAGAQHIRMIEQVVGTPKVQRLMALARHVDVMALVDDPHNVTELSEAAQAFKVNLGVLVEVEIGINRCGVLPGAPALELARKIMKAPRLEFRGLSAHEGSIMIADFEERTLKTKERIQSLVDTRELLEKEGVSVALCGAGSTSTWNIAGTMDGLTEIDPGSYALYDATYVKTIPNLGFHPALKVLTTVISRPTKDRVVSDVGLKALGIDKGNPEVEWPAGVKVNRVNSEHCILDVLDGDATQLRPGDKVMLIPQYQGTAVIGHDHYVGIRDGKVECVWEINARGAHR